MPLESLTMPTVCPREIELSVDHFVQENLPCECGVVGQRRIDSDEYPRTKNLAATGKVFHRLRVPAARELNYYRQRKMGKVLAAVIEEPPAKVFVSRAAQCETAFLRRLGSKDGPAANDSRKRSRCDPCRDRPALRSSQPAFPRRVRLNENLEPNSREDYLPLRVNGPSAVARP